MTLRLLSKSTFYTTSFTTRNAAAASFSTKSIQDYTPAYRTHPKTNLPPSIVHLGVGNFFRSHLNYLTHLTLDQQHSQHHDDVDGDQTDQRNWMIQGIGSTNRLTDNDRSIAEQGLQAALAKQSHLYSVLSLPSGATDVVGSLHGLTHVQSNVTELKKGLQHLSNATTKIISMTVTEKGYHQNNSDGGLDFNHEDIQHDLHQLSQGVTDVHAIYPLKTTLGLITAGLLLRKNQDVGGGESVTLLCCDNLPHNGNVLKRLVNEISEAVDPSLHEWIQSNVSFPNSMVDRITPAATDSTKLRIEKEMNIKDASPIQAEDFIQWVVEDNFQNGRPKWEDIECVTFVDDVMPYENMKLRMLNGGHSSLAYISSLLFMKESDQSKVTVDRVMRDKDVEQFVVQYMNEVMPTLNGGPEGPEALLNYQTSLIERFHNSEISDAVSRLCQDGSKKVTGFIVPPLKELIQNIQKENGDPKQIDMICKVIASWYVYLSCWKEVDDPSGDELVRLASGGELKQFLVVGLGSELGCNEMVWKKVETEVLFLKQNGPREFLKRC